MIGRDHELDGIQLNCHWQNVNKETAEKALSFWHKQTVLPEGTDVNQRVHQIVWLAETDEGEIIGISTAYPQICPGINMPMLFIRYMVDTRFRLRGVGGKLWLATVDLLLEKARNGEYFDCKGIASVTVNKSFRAAYSHAVLPNSGLIYIGQLEGGHPVRIRYFDGAEIS